MKSFMIALAIAAVASACSSATAQAQWELEADPIAFGLSGYSAHVGYRVDWLRVDIGAFAADVPEAFHGNQGWTAHTNGIGAKFDLLSPTRGPFAGLEANYVRTHYTLTSTGESTTRTGVAAGVRIGYRFPIGQSRLYIAPWLGVDYAFGPLGAGIAGQSFEEHRISLFPTVHIGWRF
jgi:hypothetical protein